ncbi:GATOR complex protein WDR59 isoform X2 [Aethina tumida]|uniref:GATOR complex protein WDR59 isoform X2 n=1 Tax=Aethina tumida TaxID=116153 RepID=UPI0021484120|nr:GATOR complex protein WDR59 isoform X2 [Aethina tumida]
MSTITWNKEYHVALEVKDLQANAMAVDCTGTFVLLAGRKCVAITNLNEDFSLKKIPRQSKYDVGTAEWNPTIHNKELCVISSNQRLEVLTLQNEDLTLTHSLRAHTRVITDLSWHRFDPNILASCSADTFIHIWDIRDARKPTLSLSAIAEASQVRWNRLSPNLLATAHDGDIKVWDQRKGTAPTKYISAHLSKIHGLDWSPVSEYQLASSSQDNTVKFFDTENPRRPEYVLTTASPVWRARYTPFGNGMVTVVVPQLRRGENSLLLWNTANRTTPMHTFIGHRDVVLEFEWRKQRPGDTNYQLITWSKDQTLLVWKIEPFLQKLCGHEPEEYKDTSDTISVNTIDSKQVEAKSSPKIQPLQQEFSLMNVHIPNLEVISMDLMGRTCSVKATVNNLVVNLQVIFPNAYPHGVPPVFHPTITSPNGNESMAASLLQTLNHLAQQRVSKNRTCLEPCLRQMVTSLEQLSRDAESDRTIVTPYIEQSPVFSGLNDAYIPFPRTSGAKFCSVGMLVCFGRPVHRRLGNKLESTTPRALSALENINAKRNSNGMTVSAYYFQKQRRPTKHAPPKSKATVHVYDAGRLFFVNQQLAEEYILDGDVGTICRHNAASAAAVGRCDLVQAWTLAELVAGPQQADEEMTWSQHPFGNQLMRSLISHYATQSDVQMAAMLSCIFGKENDTVTSRKTSIKSLKSPTSGGSPYHTIPPADVIAEGWVIPILKTSRSTSLDNLRLDDSSEVTPPIKDPSSALYEYYKLVYAETLHRWRLIYKRAEVIKYMCAPAESHKGVQFTPECKECQVSVKESCCCVRCKRLSLQCAICHISVRGSATCCVICGHGGHTKHLMEWFKIRDICPTGCGCYCLMEIPGVFNC